MEIKEAVKNIEAELNCRKEDKAMCMKYECREGKDWCPFYISSETLIECKCVLAKECEGSDSK